LENFSESTGAFKIIKTGTIGVSVHREESEDYAEADGAYVLTVSAPFDVDGAYTIDGEKKNDSGWYTSTEVCMVAGDGYKLLYNNDELNEKLGYTVGTKELLVTNLTKLSATPDGINKPEVYIMKDDGTVVLVTPEIKKDSTAPKGYNTGVQRKYRMYESNATFSLYSIFDGLNIKRKEKCPWKQRQSSVPPFMNGFPEMMNCKANRTVSRIRRTIWKNMPVLRDSSISGILQMMDFPGLRSIVPDFKP
jgi:hypothetical protein